MAILILFAGFMLLAGSIALIDWRRGWYLALICGVLQDPVRKMTPGEPVAITLSIVAIYALILFSAQTALRRGTSDAARRFGQLFSAGGLLFLFLIVAALNGLIRFGFEYWKVPALSLFTYLVPIPAVMLGYIFFDREERITGLLTFYTILTSVALIGVVFEYRGYEWSALGLVNNVGGTFRYLPGMEIRMLSGFYRAPDVMGFHAAMLASIGIAMAMRAKVLRHAWPWLLASAWGMINCILSGRRKAVYMVAVFAIAFVWRYMRRLTLTQAIAFFAAVGLMGFAVHNIAESNQANVYVRAAEVTTGQEIFERIEGGAGATIEQFGLMGAGLGTATQGTQHLIADAGGWQEGGLGKLTVELGVFGVGAAVLMLAILMNILMKITRAPDEPGTSQLIRCALFAMFVANVANFIVSAQAYSDATMTLFTAFLLGCLLGTAAVEERLATDASPAQRPLTALPTA